MAINIKSILRSLLNEFDNAAETHSCILSDREKEIKGNIKEILLGYENGNVITENELFEGNKYQFFYWLI